MAIDFMKIRTGVKLQPNAAPGSPEDGDIWYDSSTNSFKFRQNGSTVDISGGGGGSTVTVSTKTAAYTMTNSDDVIIMNSATDVALTMHSVATATSKPYRVKNIGAGTITILPNSSDTFDGDTSIILAGGSMLGLELIPNGGSAWYIF